MPLVWAHAEYLKLVASRKLRRPFDRPDSVWQRYAGKRPPLTHVFWTEQAPADMLPEGCALTLALREAGTVRWGVDGWQDVREQSTRVNPLGLHLLAIDAQRLGAGRCIDFTYRTDAGWVEQDFRVQVVPRTLQPD
jgi:glucoamylase